jgi:autotransporter-associated beta strand protein
VFSDAVPGRPGNLVIANSGVGGKVIFTGANTYTGSTAINNGATLAINGSMLSNVIVNAGGTLQGIGSYGGGTIFGMLAPGNSIGTINALTWAALRPVGPLGEPTVAGANRLLRPIPSENCTPFGQAPILALREG